MNLSEDVDPVLLDALRRERSGFMRLPEGGIALSTAAVERLRAFCRADESTFRADPREHALLEGRREVWLLLQDNMDTPLELQYSRLVAKRKRMEGE